jgi:hypothetical protein
MCAGVAILLGGTATVIAIAFGAAACIDRLQLVMARRRLPTFYQQVAGGALATTLGVVAAWIGLVENPALVVTANIIMLLAGIGFMGALQDALSGFYVTAGARLTEAPARHLRDHRRRQWRAHARGRRQRQDRPAEPRHHRLGERDDAGRRCRDLCASFGIACYAPSGSSCRSRSSPRSPC